MKEKVKIEIDPDADDGIVIRCRSLTPEVMRLQSFAETGVWKWEDEKLPLRLGDCEYFIPLSEILFFETNDGRTTAHTVNRMYYTDQKLYELSNSLPNFFMRVSKSCILNVRSVTALRRDVTGIGEAFFADCNKKVYISRMYYRAFREKITETKIGETD